MSALIKSHNGKTFFAHAQGLYRYWLSPAHGQHVPVLKIQVSKKIMNAFRASPEGRKAELAVDIFEVGGGWYEVRSVEAELWGRIFKGVLSFNGIRIFLAAFNLAHVKAVNANPCQPIKLVRGWEAAVGRHHQHEPSEADLQQLVARFGRGGQKPSHYGMSH